MLNKTQESYNSGNRYSPTPYVPVVPQREDGEIDILSLLGALWRGKWTVLGFALLFLILGGIYAFEIAVPRYKATTTLALELRGENVVDLESVVSGVSADTSAINTEIEVIRSGGLLKKLVAELDLRSDPEFNAKLRPEPRFSIGKLLGIITSFLPASESDPQGGLSPEEEELNRTVEAIGDAVSASNKRNTYVFHISATTQNDMKSALIANTLAMLYIQDQIDVKFQATENAVTWLSERVIELEAELKSRENAIKELRSETDLVNAETLQALNQQAKDVRDRLMESRADFALLTAKLGRLKSLEQDEDLEPLAVAIDDPTLNRLIERAGSDASARALIEDRISLLFLREESALDRSRQQVAALETSFSRLENEIEQQSDDLVKLEQLERETEATRTLYQTFLTRLKETTVQRGLQQADSRVLSNAIPGEKVAPRKNIILALCLILGALVGTGIVLMRQLLHDGFRTSEELENATGLSVFGQIPKIPLRDRHVLIDYLNEKPTSAASEAIRNLRTSVLLSDIDHPPQIIMSTSSLPGEGKTTQSLSLAQNMAGLGKKVLLIEADIRRRTFAEYFDFSESDGGLVSALTNDAPLSDLVIRPSNFGVDVLRGEKTNVNAADLFSSERFKSFLQSTREIYDYIIIDTPPVLVVPDARVIGQFVDAIIFTVAWDRTNKNQVAQAISQFDSVGLRISGLVLAQIDAKGMKRYGYGGKNGAYAAYGNAYYDAE